MLARMSPSDGSPSALALCKPPTPSCVELPDRFCVVGGLAGFFLGGCALRVAVLAVR
jgi:hypothetical protein